MAKLFVGSTGNATAIHHLCDHLPLAVRRLLEHQQLELAERRRVRRDDEAIVNDFLVHEDGVELGCLFLDLRVLVNSGVPQL